jgi:hypothetical protein
VQIKSGARLRSQVDSIELVVVRPIPGEVELTCGGHPMVDIKAEPVTNLAILASSTGGTPQGKRYTLGDTGLEILVTKAGTGALAIGAEQLVLKEARPLPASD